MLGKKYCVLFLMLLCIVFITGSGSLLTYAKDPYKDYKPKIAIVYTKRPSEPTFRYIRKCGMRAYWLGPRNPKTSISEFLKNFTEEDVEKYDGLFVPGGGDVTPGLYGQKKNRMTHNVSLRLDKLQIGIIHKFADAGKPILGICRGCQVLNVAFGGTLVQHIPNWHTWSRGIKISRQSYDFGLYGKQETVYHFHHQCVKKVAKGFVATEWDARDGHIEAIQSKTLPIYGIQWHPENCGEKGKKVGRKFRRICIRYKKYGKKKH